MDTRHRAQKNFQDVPQDKFLWKIKKVSRGESGLERRTFLHRGILSGLITESLAAEIMIIRCSERFT